MITQLKIKNFKSLQNVTLDCKNLNILTGINGMGKSSIIQVLLLLRQSYLKEYFKGKEKYLFLGESIENDLVLLWS